jgi:hypothetical protein
MISAGEVGVLFQVKDDASGTLQRIAEEFSKIQAIVDKVTEAIAKIGGADSGLSRLQEALGLTAKAGDDAGRTITESFSGVDRAVKTAAEGVNALKASFAEAAEAAKAIQVASSSIGGGMGGGGSGGPHGGGSGPHGGFINYAFGGLGNGANSEREREQSAALWEPESARLSRSPAWRLNMALTKPSRRRRISIRPAC